MPITILDYVKSVAGTKPIYTVEDFTAAGVEVLGGCQICGATLAPYNAYPSKSGYWHCADCIGDDGFATVEQFTEHETQTGRAVDWLLRVRQLQADGMDFDAALAQANAEAGVSVHIVDPKQDCGSPATSSVLLNCPSCGGVEHITEVWENAFKCGDCGAAWRL
jgi:hypothetical protein